MKINISQKRKNNLRITAYVLGSILFLLIPIITSPDFNWGFKHFALPPFQRDLFSYVLLLIYYFVQRFYFVPKLFFKKRYILFAVAILSSFAICTLAPSFFFQEGIPKMPPVGDGRGGKPPIINIPVFQNLFRFLVVCLFSFVMDMFMYIRKVQKEKTEAELAFLKSQINPHFIFNTLNSIYALSIQGSPKTPEAIAQLSNLMRYTLNETKYEWISIESEVQMIQDYLKLQSARLTEHTHCTFRILGDQTSQRQIAPMLFLPFIENTFKYGVNPDVDSDILIHLEITENSVLLNCKNQKVAHLSHLESSSKVGLENVRKRIALIYPGNHSIEINDATATFEVLIKLPLK